LDTCATWEPVLLRSLCYVKNGGGAASLHAERLPGVAKEIPRIGVAGFG
jgi:hypothetical protein